MPSHPPPLPSAILRRVLTVATVDGCTLLAVAGVGAIIAGAFGDRTGLLTGVAVCGAGALELSGAAMLRRGKQAGLRVLVASQLLLLLAIWCYAGVRLATGGEETLTALLTPDRRVQLIRLGVDPRLFMELMGALLPLLYIVVAVVSLGYQGGLAWYYHRQREAVAAALK